MTRRMEQLALELLEAGKTHDEVKAMLYQIADAALNSAMADYLTANHEPFGDTDY